MTPPGWDVSLNSNCAKLYSFLTCTKDATDNKFYIDTMFDINLYIFKKQLIIEQYQEMEFQNW